MHNIYRCMAGVPLMSWSTDLQHSAEAWVAKGIYEHSGTWHGENMAWAHPTAMSATVAWYDEIIYTNPWGFATDARNPHGYVLSHYNQIVWKTSTQIGCAFGYASRFGVHNKMWVCHYKVAGNTGSYTHYVVPPWRGIEECGGTRAELPSNAPPSPPRVACFEKRSLVANEGGTLSKQDVNTPAACTERCKNDWNCKSFTLCEAGISGCWLKNRVLTAGDAAAQTATTAGGGQQCSSYMQIPCQKNYEQRSLVADEGQHIGGVEPFVSYDKCKEICANTYGCKSFATCESGHTGCWMKKKVVSATEPANTGVPPERKCTTWREVPFADPALLASMPEGPRSVEQPIMPAGW